MTANQRRPGFRLPWASGSAEATEEPSEAVETAGGHDGSHGNDGIDRKDSMDSKDTKDSMDSTGTKESATPAAASAKPTTAEADASSSPTAGSDATPAETEAKPARTMSMRSGAPATAAAPPTESSTAFMRDLVSAMRRVAEETRQSGLSNLRTKTEEQVRMLEADAERRREDLKARAETDVAGVGEWAAAETERIKQEAEQRVVARRAHLDQQLAAETTRADAEAKTLRDRVAEYEQELDAYHAQLSDIADPAAFAAAAKRMPAPPKLAGVAADASVSSADASSADASSADASPTVSASEVHPDEEEVLTSRLAELDAVLEQGSEPSAPASEAGGEAVAPASSSSAEPTSTEILVKGLGSFGAITGFRQALAGVDGIEGVSLSLGPTGEFVFRAIHPTGFDVTSAIAKLEGDAATVEPQGDGGLRVTLDRAR